jgi:type IV pilus assembly protein PilN
MPNVQGQVSQSVGVPVMPSVNLMPPEIAEAARFRRFQLAMGGAVVAAVAVVGLLYGQAHGSVSSAQTQLAQSQTQHTALSNQLASLQSVQNVYTQVAAKQSTLSQAMGDEIRWSSYLNDLSLRIPDKVWLSTVSASETGSTATVPTTVSATAPAGIGTVTFSGTAFTHDDVATWLEVLAKERGYTNAYFTNSSESMIGPRSVVTFSSSVVLDDKAKSGRYSKPAGS